MSVIKFSTPAVRWGLDLERAGEGRLLFKCISGKTNFSLQRDNPVALWWVKVPLTIVLGQKTHLF